MQAGTAALPRELLELVAFALPSAKDLVALQQANVTWRDILRGLDELWRLLALRRFPRLAAILRCVGAATPPSYRELYRRQLMAECADRPKAAVTPPSLADFVFTVEVHSSGQLKASWTGSFGDPSELQEREVMFEGWIEPGPEWFRALKADCSADPPRSASANECVATIYSTRLMHTVKLYCSTPWVLATAECGGEDEDPVCFPPMPLPCQCQHLASINFRQNHIHEACNDLKPLPELSLTIPSDGAMRMDFGYFTTKGALWESMRDDAIAPVLALCANEHASPVRPLVD